jgi:hypothetical protein
MVLAEKNSENARNGRRSRGPSPNGHVQDSTSEDESSGQHYFSLNRDNSCKMYFYNMDSIKLTI